MKKRVLPCLCWAFLLFTAVSAQAPQSRHFTIYSDMDTRYMRFVQSNAEAYYKNLAERYFERDWLNPSVNFYADADQKPLIIHYSKTQADTQKLFNEHGHKIDSGYGYYASSIPAIYAHQFMNNGQRSGFGTLFRGITYHFIALNYSDPPAWFNEGLGSFLGGQTQIVRGELTVTGPNPHRGQVLRDKIEKGVRPNVKFLLSTSTRQFYNWSVGRHFAEALFYWLHESGQLERYLSNVRANGFEVSVLEETLSMPREKINVEFLKFIKKSCYAGAYLQDGRQSEDTAVKEQAFLKVLEIKPDYDAAKLELAKCYCRGKDYEKCRQYLKQIMGDPKSSEYRQGAKLMGDTYYDQKDYSKALEYYNRAWAYSNYYEYKYRLAYKIANCYYYTEDSYNAKQWYKKFLDGRWEPESMKDCADYARKYTGLTGTATDMKQR